MLLTLLAICSVKKQPQKRRVKKQRHGSNDDSSGADDAVVGDADEDSSSGEESNSCKRGVERSVVRRGSGRMSEYEITLMWNQCKINFPKGRLNRIQLTQLLQQVQTHGCVFVARILYVPCDLKKSSI